MLMHVSLDGFVAGPSGEMDWIQVDEEVFDYVGKLTDNADAAVFGRVTYQMMEAYWPTAAEQPNASKHDIEHAHWVNAANKLVFSKTLKTLSWNNSTLLKENILGEMARLKQLPGKNMLMIGSATLAHFFIRHGLIDEFRLFVNPVVLGSGMPLFEASGERILLKLSEVKVFNCGVAGMFYELNRS